eukprot:1018459-Prorocentrum_minimum.AAC.1
MTRHSASEQLAASNQGGPSCAVSAEQLYGGIGGKTILSIIPPKMRIPASSLSGPPLIPPLVASRTSPHPPPRRLPDPPRSFSCLLAGLLLEFPDPPPPPPRVVVVAPARLLPFRLF